jgi:tRNA nucleotidyltransferase/poly(A) polymerase
MCAENALDAAHDLDFVLEEDPESFVRFLWDSLSKWVTIDSSPVASVSEPTVFKNFGTAHLAVTMNKDLLYTGKSSVIDLEFVQARKESYDRGSRKPEVVPGTLHEDALRRDFTINTLLMNTDLGRLNVVDPLKAGRQDIAFRLLQTPTDPDTTLSDDPLRILRAFRFAQKLGFKFHPQLKKAVIENIERLQIVSRERKHDELKRMMSMPGFAGTLDALQAWGLLDKIFPGAQVICDWKPLRNTQWTAWTALLQALMLVDDKGLHWLAPLGLMAATMIKATGNPQGWDRILRTSFNLSNDERQALGNLVISLTSPATTSNPQQYRSSNTLNSWGLVGLELRQAWERALMYLEIDEQNLTPRTSPLTGDQILELTGLAPGKQIGHLKKGLEHMVLSGSLQPGDEEAAKEWLQKQVETLQYELA